MAQEQLKLVWTEVDSSNVHSVAFHEPTETLAIKFVNGTLYSYDEANNDMFVDLIHAVSVGEYLNQVVKVKCTYTKWNDEAELIAHILR